MTSPTQPLRRSVRSIVLLFIGVPIVWALHLLTSYFIITLGCRGNLADPKAWLAVLTALALGAGAAIGLRAYRTSREGEALADAAEHEVAGPHPTSHFLITTGAALSAVFLFGIFLLALPFIFLPVCG